MSPEAPSDLGGPVKRRRRMALPISRRRALFEWLALAFLLSGPLLGSILFGAVRVWSAGPLMVLVWLALAFYAGRALFNEETRRLTIPPGGLIWLLVWVFLGLHIRVASIPYEARWEWLKAGSGLAAYWIWTELSSRHRRWRTLIALLLFALSLLAWYALIQHAHGSRMVLTMERPEQYGMRASGTYMCPNHFANLLALAVPFSVALLILSSAGAFLRLFAGYSLLLFLPVLYFTQSRSAWLGVAAGVAVTISLVALRKSLRRFLLVLVAGPLALALLGAALWTVSPMVRERVSGARLDNPDPAVKARFDVWKDTLPMIKECPLLGFGGGSYQWIHPRFRSHGLPLLINYAHNEYLQFAADYGLVGLALFGVAFLVTMGRLLLRLRRTERDKDAYFIAALCGSAAAALVHAVFDFNLHLYANNQVLIMLAGVVAGGLVGGGEIKSRPLSVGQARLVWGPVLILALVLAVLTAQGVASYLLHRFGEGDREQYEMVKAERLLRLAGRLDPGNPNPWISLGHIYRTKGFWDLDAEQKQADREEAMAFYEKGLARNPLHTMGLYGVSRLYAAQGDQEKALELLRQVNQMYRNNQFFVTQLGIQLRQMGRYQEALDVFRAAAAQWSTPTIQLNVQLLERQLAEPAP